MPEPDHNFSRRIAMGIILSSPIAIATGLHCSHESSHSTNAGADGALRALEIRTNPIVPRVYPPNLREPIDHALLTSALDAVDTHFVSRRLPVPLIYHAVRMWGPTKGFSILRSIDSKPSWKRADRPLISVMLDDEQFTIYSSYGLKSLLRRSPYGVQVASYQAIDKADAGNASHVGKYHDTMAKLGVPSTTPLKLSDGSTATLADAIRDEAYRFRPEVEIEWISQALICYMSHPVWINRFDEQVSLNNIVSRVASRSVGTGDCDGTHIAHVLATALAVDREKPYLTPDVRTIAQSYLSHLCALLSENQRSDGTWDKRWFDVAKSRRGQIDKSFVPLAEMIGVTGHHLEWLLITPPEFRISDDALERALQAVIGLMPRASSAIQEDWHVYAPVSHAGRAILMATGEPVHAGVSNVAR